MAKQTLTGDKEYVQWSRIGQEVSGVLIRLEVSKHEKYKGELVILQTDEGKIFCSAPTTLAEILRDNFDKLHGEYITIRYTEDVPVKGGTLKKFEVDFEEAEEK